jgi:hypothetical protein
VECGERWEAREWFRQCSDDARITYRLKEADTDEVPLHCGGE